MTPPATPTDADARFDRVVDRWFRDRLRLAPEMATYLGVHDRDGELASGSREGIDEEVALARQAMVEMERFEPSDLSSERALDRDLLLHEARLSLHELTEQRQWERRSGAAEHLGDALFPLLTRQYAPLPDRLASIAARLEATPRFLAERQGRVTDPVGRWAQIDLESTRQLPAFLDTILAVGRSEVRDEALLGGLEAAITAAKQALSEHAAWLERDLVAADGDWRLGPERFEELVRLRELGADGDTILAVGEAALAESRAAREAVGREIDPTLGLDEVQQRIKDDHPPTFADVLEEYRGAVERARRFVAEHELATLPPDDRLAVIETPVFLRHTTPFAAYYEPARFEAEPLGTYIVTPPASPEALREHAYAGISNTCVHEAYPGHHLQLSAANTNPSLVRLLVSGAGRASDFVEGWALYCERMMKRAGFDDGPQHRFMQYLDEVWRATRVVVDVRINRRQMGFDEAVDFLIAQTGFERASAVAELNRYTSTPSYQLSYLFGRHLIESLRDEVERREGHRFNLKRFHDTLLYGGVMPVTYARRLFSTHMDR